MKDNFTTEEVASILHELFGDSFACNYCNNDEWLPYVCDYRDDCPLTFDDDLLCWKQYLKHLDKKDDVLNGFYE